MKKEVILNLDDPKDFKKFMDMKEAWLNDAWKEACQDPRLQPIYTKEDLYERGK